MFKTINKAKVKEMFGYDVKTTFYDDFSIADAFGISAIKDTYKRGLETCMALGYIYLTEFVMALNWKIWEHYQTNDTYGRLYNDLWMQAEDIARDTLQGEELEYYYRTTD